MQCQFILGLIHVFDKKDIVCRHKNINKKAKVCNKERQEKNLSIHLFSFVDTFSRFKYNKKKLKMNFSLTYRQLTLLAF